MIIEFLLTVSGAERAATVRASTFITLYNSDHLLPSDAFINQQIEFTQYST